MAGHTVCLYSSLGSKVLTICRAVHDACPHPYRDSIASLTSVISLVQNHCPPAQYTLPSTGSREPKTIETGSSDHKPFPWLMRSFATPVPPCHPLLAPLPV